MEKKIYPKIMDKDDKTLIIKYVKLPEFKYKYFSLSVGGIDST